MIIKDIKGGKLRLSKTSLTEISGSCAPGVNWTLLLSKLYPVPSFGAELPITGKESGSDSTLLYGYAMFKLSGKASTTIGCRTFNKKTFALIMKAARDLKGK